MAGPHRKGHRFKNGKSRKQCDRKQRRSARQYLKKFTQSSKVKGASLP